MRALRGGQLYFVIPVLKVINEKEMQVSVASLLTCAYCYPAWEFQSIQVEE